LELASCEAADFEPPEQEGHTVTKVVKKQADAPQLAIRVPDFCKRIGLSRSTFWKYHKLGRIRTVSLGARVVVPADEVARILKEGVARG
jgi:predicted DNA-binding transcriptional regulator AlpA